MRVLVTGGAGYIGSVAVERLVESGHDVVVIDNLARGHHEAIHSAAEVVACDLRDSERTRDVVAGSNAKALMHFAALTLVPESVAMPSEYFHTNVVGGYNLMAAALAAGIERVVFSSTAAVYGVPTTLPITEDVTPAPINPYGHSKLMVERMLEAFSVAYGLHYAALRYFNVAGATKERGENHNPETHVIPVALQVLLGQRDHFSVFGTDYPTADGTAVRDYVHVVDLVDAHLLALERLDRTLGPINLGTRDGFSVKQIVAAVERVTGRELPVQYAPRRAGDPPTLIADCSKATAVLGWKPVRSTLDEMIASAWDWHQRHPNGYEGSRRAAASRGVEKRPPTPSPSPQ